MVFKDTQDIILELKGEIIGLKEELHKNKNDYKELQQKYINLRARYNTQSDELLRLKIQLSKEDKNDN
jgi:hypothetical protein